MSHLPDWARASGHALFTGQIRQTPADFVVVEKLAVEFSGDGEHDWLRIRKTGVNTHWVAEQLARHAGMPAREAGYSGLKDRHAVTEQWFSVKRIVKAPTDWSALDVDGVEVLDSEVHGRKLKRGTHRGNEFRITVRGQRLLQTRDAIDERLREVAACGVPNYFGEQRFGRDGGNIELGQAVLSGRRMARQKRSIGISALRSLAFNRELDERVREGSWNRLLAGDTANLAGSGSVFQVDQLNAELEQRCQERDIHPCGSLPAIDDLGVAAAHRPLRLCVHDLGWQVEDDRLLLTFTLDRGGYATAVLRELCAYSSSP